MIISNIAISGKKKKKFLKKEHKLLTAGLLSSTDKNCDKKKHLKFEYKELSPCPGLELGALDPEISTVSMKSPCIMLFSYNNSKSCFCNY